MCGPSIHSFLLRKYFGSILGFHNEIDIKRVIFQFQYCGKPYNTTSYLNQIHRIKVFSFGKVVQLWVLTNTQRLANEKCKPENSAFGVVFFTKNGKQLNTQRKTYKFSNIIVYLTIWCNGC